MANILYRGSSYTTANTAGSKNAPLTNDEIDRNFYSLDLLKFDKAGGTISGATTINGDLTIGSNGNVTIAGNLTVGGTTTTINSTILNVDDINIELGAVAQPTDATANGGGITLLGASNKTITWDSTNGNWTSNQDWNIVNSKVFKINNVSVLSATTLGSGVTSSSLTKVGLTTAGFVKSDASGNLSADTNSYSLTSHGHYIGTTAVQGSSAAQAVTGVSSLTNAAGSALAITTTNHSAASGSLTLQSGNTTNASAGSGYVALFSGDATGAGSTAGLISIYAGKSNSASGANVSIVAGTVSAATSQGGYVLIRGGIADTGATTAGSGGHVYIAGGYAYAASGNKTGGNVYIDGGQPIQAGTNTNGSVYLGTGSSGFGNFDTASVNIGKNGIVTTVNGTVKLPDVGTSGFVKLGAGGQLSNDTNTYLTGNQSISISGDATGSGATAITLTLATVNNNVGTFNNVTVNAKGLVTAASNVAYLTSYSETSTLANVTSRGASTSTASTFSGGLTATGITVSKSGTDSTITFPAQTNDPGYIKHYESNNNAVMYFSVSDDAGANDYFSFGNTSNGYVEGLRITASGVVSVGTWQASSISTTYTDAKITSISANAPISRDNSTGAVTISHNTSGVTAGTYNNVTVNTYGHVTGGSNTAYLTSYTETSTLANVTSRGASTSTASTFSGGLSLAGSTLNLRSSGIGTGYTISTSGNSGASPVSNYAAGHSSAGIYIDVNAGGDNGGIYIGEDACTIWNAADSGYLFRIIEEDNWQSTGANFATSTGTDPGYAVGTAVKFVVDGAGNVSCAGSLTASGNVTAYSDVRLKTNIKTIENALDTTLKLRGVTFQKDGKDGLGVIAQEIKEVLPELVHEANDEQKTLSVAYGNIVGVLIEAIKELNAKVEDLQNQLANK